ncbi:MAG TPA: hypothetical protein P5337_13480 [Aestuariivirga sp.]|nr:hypothetical protein [Aestuariivirga sp.]
MKVILTIFCILVILFAGGCALVLFAESGTSAALSALSLALIPGGIVALNVAVIAALWGMAKPGSWVFIVLAILDAIVVLFVLAFWASSGWGDPSLDMLTLLTAAAFAAKGALSIAVLKDLKTPADTASTQDES